MEDQSLDSDRVPAPSRCPLCVQPATFSHLEVHVDRDVRYDLYECAQCRAQFWEPLRNPGSEWYESDPRYAGANADPPRDLNWHHRKTVSFLRRQAGLPRAQERGMQAAKALDVGCGTGHFLSWARACGWDVYGIDFDANAVRASTEVFGLPHIEKKTLSDTITMHPEYAGSFDLVTFFDLFEHIDNHNEFAEQVKLLLRDGGYIAMSMPYRDGGRSLQLGDLPPRHLTRWNRESLEIFWRKHGFRVIYMKREPVTYLRLVAKYRFKYGNVFSFGLVNKVKKTVSSGNAAAGEKDTRVPFRVRLAHALAKTKDIILFGIPALFLWLTLLPSEKRYIGLFMVAQKSEL